MASKMLTQWIRFFLACRWWWVFLIPLIKFLWSLKKWWKKGVPPPPPPPWKMTKKCTFWKSGFWTPKKGQNLTRRPPKKSAKIHAFFAFCTSRWWWVFLNPLYKISLIIEKMIKKGGTPPSPYPPENAQKMHFLKKWFLDPQKRPKSNEEAPQKKCQNPYKNRILH